ncbi:MAG: peptidylprolyl isomerase [Ignavibacteriota bacterium]|jgi:FKBP-type peptidyl-prolyl cis-trans isomerase SlyD|nr:MAG: peptidylprolyl isomerase [Chlorobiota bacterium]MBE7475874.1 peptidylprolyl isomerase [Ignavibacteriales bacterium]MBL1123318.1 peptidylprolyl isomerase [Ignavibacteriota bacterium]MCC7095413.1 peptidylprolyl isomerase [Ignavibacteriaceae bacterium]MCE7856519.1 peptidylprolyl isomerase [Ignavibacteria bacterium CHB3]MEB2295448.1 peptidylprolyl isomerase [Ignavibacteria bacterium]
MALMTNKVITINYTLKDKEGNLLDSTDNGGPFSFITGNMQVLPGLEEALVSMIIGSKKNIKLAAADAYGEYDENAIQKVNRSLFPEEAELETGMTYFAHSPEGQHIQFVITKIENDDITVNFNHPLAGKNLEFDVELLDVRDATPEEISHGHVHGPGGHHHH